MKQFKSIITVLILAIAVAGVTTPAAAQKEPIKKCSQCGNSLKASQFPGGGNVCGNCVKANKKAEEKAKKEAEKKAKEEAKRKAQEEAKKKKAEEKARKDAEKREVERKEAERREAERREAERKKAEQEKIINDYVNSMVYVEGGTFEMGATKEQGKNVEKYEKPVHKVTLSSYYIGKTEVTQELWEVVMGNNPSDFMGPKLPVENVSWYDCQDFIRKLNQMTGMTFRLPTEAEWEFAARGGNRSYGYKYAGGNDLNEVAWCFNNSGNQPLIDEIDNQKLKTNNCRTHEVATKRPNELGLYDMTGNVWEWCSDYYGKYSKTSQTNPTGPKGATNEHVYRGGGLSTYSKNCYVARRGRGMTDTKINFIGFRLAKSNQ